MERLVAAFVGSQRAAILKRASLASTVAVVEDARDYAAIVRGLEQVVDVELALRHTSSASVMCKEWPGSISAGFSPTSRQVTQILRCSRLPAVSESAIYNLKMPRAGR